MTSKSSGYITMGNRNENDTGPWFKVLHVPSSGTLVVSYKQFKRGLSSVNLLLNKKPYDDFVGLIKHKSHISRVWKSSVTESNFHSMYRFKDSQFVVKVNWEGSYVWDFKFLFSFFPMGKGPQTLSTGLLNCSVELYSSFQHHVNCNLKTECDDGRDETEHCPFSSIDCQGLIAWCGHCYKVIWDVGEIQDDKTRGNEMANKHCRLSGCIPKIPMCLNDPYKLLAKTSKRYWKIPNLCLGLRYGEKSMPRMYKRSLCSEDRIVFHHHFNLRHLNEFDNVLSYVYLPRMRVTVIHSTWSCGTMCEIRINITKQNSDFQKNVHLTTTGVSLLKRQFSLTVCIVGHLTHKYLSSGLNQDKLCGQHCKSSYHYPEQASDINLFNSTDDRTSVPFTFMCNNELTMTLSYSLVCDFTADCLDSRDESFCKHPVCTKTFFTCTNGQCVSYDNMCDGMPHCMDESDEICRRLEMGNQGRHILRVTYPAVINFNGISRFTSEQMKSNDSCPDSHYRCPGQFNDCLPLYTRCNGMNDCIERQDEEGCEQMTCPGLFQCRLSQICVHSDHICDGWPHCPMHDDELWCTIECPEHCLCQAYSFQCVQPFNAKLFPQIRLLDASGTSMTPSDVSSNLYLIHLVLVRCSLTVLPEMKLLNLRVIDLTGNELHYVNMTSFHGLENIQSLSLSNNPITSLSAYLSSHIQRPTLTSIDLSQTQLTVLDPKVFAIFPRLQKLNLTSTSIHTISPNGFQYIPHLIELYMDGSPLETFPEDIFKDLSHLRFISAQNYKLCCNRILPSKFDGSDCHAPKDEISSCEDLLQSWTYRGFLWLMTCLAVSGNLFCFCARVFVKRMASSSGFTVFVTNLTMADFLMGAYMTIIGVADEQFRGKYLHYDDLWKNSVSCKVAGFLSLLSCEVSALVICFITLDRFVVICFPFSTLRFGKTSAAVVCLLTWLVGWCIALLPLLPVTSHWEFYSQTSICIPLPVTRQDFKGKVYSFSVLIAFNFILFLLISIGQASIYWSVQYNSFKINSTKVSRDMTIARRLITIALTDFMCWFPIGLCGMLASAGIPVPGQVNVAMAIFIMPLNSSINPFMYTLNTWKEKHKKSKEIKLLAWMKAHADLISEEKDS